MNSIHSHALRRRSSRPAVLALLTVVSVGALSPGLAGGAELASRYRDPVRGFSLCPPVGATREKQTSPSKLVTWYLRDPNTGGIVWTLEVHEAIEARKDIELAGYARELAAKISKDSQLRVERDSVRVGVTGGKPSIHFHGTTTGNELYQRQTWVLAEPQRFLIFAMSGPTSRRARLDRLYEAVLKTLTLTDPEQARSEQKANIVRGQQLLAKADEQALARVISTEPTWYVFTYKGQAVGWLARIDMRDREDGNEGFATRSWARVSLPGQPTRWMQRKLFTTADRGFEKWSESVKIGQGSEATRIDEEGLRSKQRVVVQVAQDGRKVSRQQEVPLEWYLPKAMGDWVPRLMSLDKPGAAAFATYNATTNRVDLRTVTVLGRQTIPLGGSKIAAIHLTDQPNYDQEPAHVWVDGKGRILRMQTQEGLGMQQADLSVVLREFPDAGDIARRLRRYE
jgi:hypothetical protein